MISLELATLSNQEDCALKTKYSKSQLKPYIIPFDDKPAKEHETYELVNNGKDDQIGELVKK